MFPLAQTSRDKKLRIFDPRAGTAPVRIGDGHAGVKGSRIVWLGGHDRIATTGVRPLLLPCVASGWSGPLA